MDIYGKIAAATVLLTSFSACLRVFEAHKLTCQRVALPGNFRLAACPSGTAEINIHDAKTSGYTGKLQLFKVSDRHGIKFLAELKHRSTANTARIASIPYQQYTDELRQSLNVSNCKKSHSPFTPPELVRQPTITFAGSRWNRSPSTDDGNLSHRCATI